MAELSVHSSGDEAASGSQAAEGSSDADKEASHGQDSERQGSGEGSEGAQPEDDAPARCCCAPVPSLYCRVKHEGSPEALVLSLEHSRHDACSGRAGSAS